MVIMVLPQALRIRRQRQMCIRDRKYVLHAEANAITKVAASTNNCSGATVYVTASPCIECAKLIIQAGIKRVVYSEEYHLRDGVELLQHAGVEVLFLEGE